MRIGISGLLYINQCSVLLSVFINSANGSDVQYSELLVCSRVNTDAGVVKKTCSN